MNKKRKTNSKKSDLIKKSIDKEIDTEDIYDDKQREQMLENDEITAAENAFMQGREMKSKKYKKYKKHEHDDSISVELAKQEYEED